MTLLRVQVLEDRIVFDGAIAADVSSVPGSNGLVAAPVAVAPHDAPLHVLVIPHNTPDYQTLVDALKDPHTVTIVYDYSNESIQGLGAQITNALQGQKADTITFATEGNVGAFRLVQNNDVNGTTLQEATMINFWRNLSTELTPSGSVNILGCNVAGTAAGQSMLSNLDAILDSQGSKITVHASTDLTGSAELGGNWILEYSTDSASGALDLSTSLFNPVILSPWSHSLVNEGTVTTTVWRDLNLNGIQDSGEPGISGLTVEIFNNASPATPVQTGTTDANGVVTFSLLPGNTTYFLEWEIPAGHQITTLDVNGGPNTAHNNDSDATTTLGGFAKSGTFTLPNNGTIQTVDAGMKFYDSGTDAGTAGNFVWNDVNYNGIQDPGEVGIQGVTVSLIGNYQSGASVVLRTTTTDVNGIYSFANLPAVGGLPDVLFVIDNSGSTKNIYSGTAVGDVNGDGISNTILDGELAAFRYLVDGLIHDGFGATANVGMVVFGANATQIDMNGSGAGTILTLHPDQIGDGSGNFLSGFFNSVVKSIKSNGGSTNYDAALVKANAFFTTQGTLPTEGSLIFLSDGFNNTGGSFTSEVTSLSNKGIDLWSFGIGSGSSLTQLQLIDPAAIQLTTTDQLIATFADFSFQLTSYQIQFTLPSGYVFTLQNQGADPTKDSNADPLTGQTDPFAIQRANGSHPTSVDNTLDAGMTQVPIPNNDAYSTDQNQTLTVPVAGVLTNDTNPRSASLTATLGTTTSHGTLAFSSDGSFVYTPNNGYVGYDTFTYSISDGTIDSTTLATVTISVARTVDIPTAGNDSYQTDENIVLNVPATGVLANDVDISNDPLTAVLDTTTTHGTLILNADGSFTYTPNVNFFGTDTFTYHASDGFTPSNIATVTITVVQTADIPVAENDLYSVYQDNTLVVPAAGVLTNDVDVNHDPLTAVLFQTTTHGTLTLNSDGSFTYTPDAGYFGTDSFSYYAFDGTNNSNLATAGIVIHGPGVPVDDHYSVNENNFLTVNAANGVLSNDTESQNNPLTVTLVSTTQNGVLVLNADGSFTYTPDLNFIGHDFFTYTVNNGHVDSAPATATIFVNGPPVANPDSYTVNQNNPLNVSLIAGVLANDTDPNNDALVSIVVTQPSYGTLNLNFDGSFTYTPDTNFGGVDTFTYKASDGSLDSNVTTVTITVNTPTVANNDSYNVAENGTLTIPPAGVLTNDTDTENNPLTAAVNTDPSHGVLTLNDDGSFVYTPDVGYVGVDTFTYIANDGNSDSNPATVTITIIAPPVANGDSYTASRSTVNFPNALVVSNPQLGLLGNDTDPAQLSLTAIVDSLPTDGVLTAYVNGPVLLVGDLFDGTFVYTPNNGFFGHDSFTYHDTNGTSISTTATVDIQVDFIKPAANADSYTAIESTPLVITNSTPVTGVLSNDTDVYNEPLTAELVQNAAHGVVILNADGTFNYTPDAGFVGIDTFTYQARDTFTYQGINILSFTSDPATVSITVIASPIAVGDSYNVYQNGVLIVTAPNGVIANDQDPNNGNSNQFLTVDQWTQPAHGVVAVNTDGAFIYTPNPGYLGPDSFTYQVTDGAVASDGTLNVSTATVDITLFSPPTAQPDSYSVAEDHTLSIPTAGVLDNELTPTDNPLGVPVTAHIDTSAANGQVILNADGSFTYTPNSGFVGIDTFTYHDNYGLGANPDANTNIVTVTIHVVAPPVAQNDTYTTTRDIPITVNTQGGILANDSDPNSPSLAFTSILEVGPQHGTLGLNTDGSFTYTPNAGFFGIDTFTYHDTNGTAFSNTATVLIHVDFILPSAANDTYATGENHSLTIGGSNSSGNTSVLNNDSDAYNLPLTAVLDQAPNPADGTLTLNSDGTFTFTPALNFFGTTTFTYHVNDGFFNSSAATVTIHVIAPPVTVNDAYSMNTNNTLIINAGSGVLSNDHDINNPPLSPFTVSLVTGPNDASAFTLNADGSFTYTPNLLFFGTDTFTYQAISPIVNSDGTLNVSTATVSITVEFLRPSANVDNYTVNRNTVLQVTNPALGVLNNDTDTYQLPLTAVLDIGPQHGTLVFHADGTFTYTPNVGFFGTDTFTYHAQDTFTYNTFSHSFDSIPVVNTITVVSLEPTANSDNYSTTTNGQLVVNNANQGLVHNDTDPYGETLTVVQGTYTQPANGTVVVHPDGTFTYTPNSLFTGIDTFTYQVNDGATNSAFATVTIEVDFIRPAVNGDSYTAERDTTLVVSSPGVLNNDSDTFHLPLSIDSYTNPSHGTLVLNADGSFTYTPNPGYYGPDSFTYTAKDTFSYHNVGFSFSSDPLLPATVDITVISLPPIAGNDSYAVASNSTLNVTNPSQGILANSTSLYNDPLTLVNVTNPANGVLVVHADGTFTYTPNEGFFGIDHFTFQVNDGITTSNVGIVAIAVQTQLNQPFIHEEPEGPFVANAYGLPVYFAVAQPRDVFSFKHEGLGTPAYFDVLNLNDFADLANMILVSPFDGFFDELGNYHGIFTISLLEQPGGVIEIRLIQSQSHAPHSEAAASDIAANTDGGHQGTAAEKGDTPAVADESVVFSQDTLIFTPDNWFIPQTVQVTIPPDGKGDGEVVIEIVKDSKGGDSSVYTPLKVKIPLNPDALKAKQLK